jgi:pSer/pThr/pTyr-binding forkhead associated (FHA) protein
MNYPATSGVALVIRHTGQVFSLTRHPVAIGRQADNTIILSDPQASRHHASISWQAGTYLVQDMGSANGTYVNGQRISAQTLLRPGDVLRVGGTIFDVRQTLTGGDTGQMPVSPPTFSGVEAPSQRSGPSLVIGLLLVAIVIAILIITMLLLLPALTGKVPTVTIQWPAPDAEVIAGSEIILQAAASGARDISRLELSVDGLVIAVTTSANAKGEASLTALQPWTFRQPGFHTVMAVAYTARGKVSAPASVVLAVVEAEGERMPHAAPSELTRLSIAISRE